MTQYIRVYGGYAAIISSIALLGVIAVPFVSWFARRHRRPLATVVTGLMWLLCLICTLTVIVITLAPTAATGRTMDLVPFSTIVQMVTQPTCTTWLQLLGNVLLLSWIGLIVPVLSGRADVKALTIAGAAVSIAIELLQWFVADGRATTFDDVMLNTIGVWIGAWVGVRKAAPRLRSFVTGVQPGRRPEASVSQLA